MTISRKINLSLVGLGILIAVFVAFIIYPLFSGIQKESENFVSQKRELAELGIKTQNLKTFQVSHEDYRANFEKIEELLINPSEPVNFIEFLEKEAGRANLSIEILSLPLEKDGKPWPSMNFRLSLGGPFPNFLKFLEKLESAPYLIEILNLSSTKKEEERETTLLIKVYTQ